MNNDKNKSGNSSTELDNAKNKIYFTELIQNPALSINDQEMANGLGIEPEQLKQKAIERSELPLTIGNIFTGYWSNNWQEDVFHTNSGKYKPVEKGTK